MSVAATPREQLLEQTIRDLVRRVETLERLSSGTNSIGSIAFRPGRKAGTPSDADYPAAALPPIGWVVCDTTGSKLWARTAVGTWKGVAIV